MITFKKSAIANNGAIYKTKDKEEYFIFCDNMSIIHELTELSIIQTLKKNLLPFKNVKLFKDFYLFDLLDLDLFDFLIKPKNYLTFNMW